MRLPPLRRATLLRRYKRFLADVRLEDGTEETVHVPNPGAMLGLADPGRPVWVSRSEAATRKLPLTLELVEADGGALVGVNTMAPNRLVAEALAEAAIPELAGYAGVRREAAYGAASRVDFLLEGPCPAWVEVKGVTLSREAGQAEWPDCVSVRASRHAAELAARAALGERAVVLFVVQRADCDRLAVAADLDPAFARSLAEARTLGVEVLAYGCEMDLTEVRISGGLALAGRGLGAGG